MVDALERLERAVSNTHGAILDALKSTPTVSLGRPTRSRLWVALWAGLASAVLSGVGTYAAMILIAPRETTVDPRLQVWADSWSYLWRVSPGFRECWTNFVSTRQPQQCTLLLDSISPNAGGKR